jgi:hypothetical protein
MPVRSGGPASVIAAAAIADAPRRVHGGISMAARADPARRCQGQEPPVLATSVASVFLIIVACIVGLGGAWLVWRAGDRM